MTTTIEKPGLIYQTIPAIMSELPAIGKGRKNEAQHYSFRGIDDVYLAVNPILAKHKVFMRSEIVSVKREERPSKSGGVIAFVMISVRYFFVASDGSFVSTEVIGEGMDSGDKASAKALSVAQKYAILQMFCIPTSEPKDIEDDNPDPAPRRTAVSEDDDPFADAVTAETAETSEKDAFRTVELTLSDGKKRMFTKFEAYAKFGKVKEAIGEEAYYIVLKLAGHKHANNIPDKMLPAVYAMLIEKAKK